MTLFEEIAPVACNLCGGEVTEQLGDNCGLGVVRCRRCGLVYINPQPTEEALRRHYSRAELFAEEPRRSWFDVPPAQRGLQARRRLAMLKRCAPTARNGSSPRLLDVGCGMGDLLLVARAAGWETAGFEISVPSADYARREYGLENVVAAPDLQAAGFEAGAFDVVSLFHVLEHTRDPLGTMRAARDLLRPGGAVVVEVPNEGYLYAPAHFESLTHQVHLYHFTDGTLRTLLIRAGFDPIHIGLCAVGYPDLDWRRRLAADGKSVVKRALFRLVGVSFERGLRAVARRST